MLYILADEKVLFVDLPESNLQEIFTFLKPEMERIQNATKKDYSICYKKESDEVFCIHDYKNQLQHKDSSNKIPSFFSDILNLSSTSFEKADLNNIFSLDAVIFKHEDSLFIQAGTNSKIINKKGFWKKLLIDTNHYINTSVFLALGNKINAMYCNGDLCFDSPYGLRILSLLKFTKELSSKEIRQLIPRHINFSAVRSFNRKNSRILSVILQDEKYFSTQHLMLSQQIASKFNPPISFPFDGTNLVLPQDQTEIENILSIIADKMFQSNYESNILIKANSVEKIS